MGRAGNNSEGHLAVLSSRRRSPRGWIVSTISSESPLQRCGAPKLGQYALVPDKPAINMRADSGPTGRCKTASANTPTSTAPNSKTTTTPRRLLPPRPFQTRTTHRYQQPRRPRHPSRKHRRRHRLRSRGLVIRSAHGPRSSRWRAITVGRRVRAMSWCRRRRMMLRVRARRSEGGRTCMILYSNALSGIYTEGKL